MEFFTVFCSFLLLYVVCNDSNSKVQSLLNIKHVLSFIDFPELTQNIKEVNWETFKAHFQLKIIVLVTFQKESIH